VCVCVCVCVCVSLQGWVRPVPAEHRDSVLASPPSVWSRVSPISSPPHQWKLSRSSSSTHTRSSTHSPLTTAIQPHNYC